MGNTLWKLQPNVHVVKLQGEVADLITRLTALEAVVEAQAGEIGKFREELTTRHKVLSDDISAVEHRITTRLEIMEDAQAGKSDYSTKTGENSENPGGITLWSQRKAKLREAAADPSKFQPKKE